MIDNPMATLELLVLMEKAFPITTMIPPSLGKVPREQSPELIIPRTAVIQEIEYLGDAGGIMCVMDVDATDDDEHTLFISLTNLKIDGRHPLSRRITAYQKRRMKRIAEGQRLGILGPPRFTHEYTAENTIDGP